MQRAAVTGEKRLQLIDGGPQTQQGAQMGWLAPRTASRESIDMISSTAALRM
jgi:hypothetical protein